MAADSTPGMERMVSRVVSMRRVRRAHVGGFVPGAADLKGEDVGGVEAGMDAAELLEAAEQ